MNTHDPLVLEHRDSGPPVVHYRSCTDRVIGTGRVGRVYRSEVKDAAAYGWTLCKSCRPEKVKAPVS